MIKLVTKKLNNLLKVTHLLSGRSKIWSKSSCKVCALLFGHATLTLCYVQGPRSAMLWKLRVFRHKIHTIMGCFLGAFGTLWIGGNVAIISTISWESPFLRGKGRGTSEFPFSWVQNSRECHFTRYSPIMHLPHKLSPTLDPGPDPVHTA